MTGLRPVRKTRKRTTMPATKRFVVPEGQEDGRLDVCLSGLSGMSRSAVQRLIGEGMVLLNGKPAGKKDSVRSGDEILLTEPDPVPSRAEPEEIPLDIVYEDADILVINKPSGMVVHPAPGHEKGTLVNALLSHCKGELSGIGGVFRPGIVHRIDRETSGLLVAAKTDRAHAALSDDLKTPSIVRTYLAITAGHLKDEQGTVDAPVGRHPADRKKMAVIRDPDKRARNAVTHYRVIRRLNGADLVECVLETGRTHQIRVHMASLGHPVMGDPLYGGDKNPFFKQHPSWFEGQCLHAAGLDLTHPVTQERMHFECPLPDPMRRVLDALSPED